MQVTTKLTVLILGLLLGCGSAQKPAANRFRITLCVVPSGRASDMKGAELAIQNRLRQEFRWSDARVTGSGDRFLLEVPDNSPQYPRGIESEVSQKLRGKNLPELAPCEPMQDE